MNQPYKPIYIPIKFDPGILEPKQDSDCISNNLSSFFDYTSPISSPPCNAVIPVVNNFEPQQKTSNNSKVFIWVAVIAVALILIGVVIWFFSQKKKQEKEERDEEEREKARRKKKSVSPPQSKISPPPPSQPPQDIPSFTERDGVYLSDYTPPKPSPPFQPPPPKIPLPSTRNSIQNKPKPRKLPLRGGIEIMGSIPLENPIDGNDL